MKGSGAVVFAVLIALWQAGLRRGATPVRSTVSRRRRNTNVPARAANDNLAANPTRSPHSPYAAVSIKPGANICESAAGQLNVRFLKRAAPHLPLAGCDRAHCACTFEHHNDRRRSFDGERRLGVGLKSELYGTAGEPERRSRRGRRGRRKTDLP